MPAVNLELQIKFLDDLDTALRDAKNQYGSKENHLRELHYMHSEVMRAKKVVLRRLEADADMQKKPSKPVNSAKEEYLMAVAG